MDGRTGLGAAGYNKSTASQEWNVGPPLVGAYPTKGVALDVLPKGEIVLGVKLLNPRRRAARVGSGNVSAVSAYGAAFFLRPAFLPPSAGASPGAPLSFCSWALSQLSYDLLPPLPTYS